MHAIRLQRSPSSNDRSCLSATLDFSLGRTQTGIDWTQSMTSSYSKTSVFVCAHENDKPVFSKNSILGTVFESLKTPLTCGRKDKQRKKSPFSKISRYVWTGPKSLLNVLVRYAGGGGGRGHFYKEMT